jgi:hypothetical protein
MDFLTAAIMRYYSKGQSQEVTALVNDHINADIRSIEPELLCIFHDILTKEPCCYWDKSIYDQTYTQLSDSCSGKTVNIGADIMEHFWIGYSTYSQITDIINDLERLNDSPEIKNRLYRIPTYISIVEGCLTNLFRFILLILDQTSPKDFACQRKLSPICEALQSNGFELLVRDVNVNVRNAINHGGVIFKNSGQEIDFLFTANRQAAIETLKTYEFDELINEVYDTASGVLLGIAHFLNNHSQSVSVDRTETTFISFSLFGMALSLPTIRCRSISGLRDRKQLNMDFYISNSDRTFLVETAIEISMIAYSRFSDYQQYMISFSNERLQSSWIRFANQDVNDMITRKRELSDVLTDVIKRQDCLIWDVSTEDIDLQEVRYFRFPNYAGDKFKVNRVKEASIADRKRLRAHLYIGDMTSKNEIIDAINQAIEWLKTLKNAPSPTLPHKYGTMEADSVYINVYRADSRGNKGMYPTNDNLVCFVDYNVDGVTTLRHGGIFENLWRQFYHEKIGNIQIAWREAKYAAKQNHVKVGRNAPCPCGSGKKYKKCCLVKIKNMPSN